ncbi:MAG: hypothetical protein QOD73_1319, partial [Solirubrobacteraceae bacterium]|nr:hypothetical protein [Solirubrobacteraceae bacterium]
MARTTGVPSGRSPAGQQRTPLDRLPAWATTGVGSLPHTFPEPAAAHAVGEYDVPFCPQLPRLEGDMVTTWLGADPLRCGWSPDRDRERPAAWDAFLAALARRPPAHGVVKLQVTGPVTLARALAREPAAVARLADGIAAWLAAAAAAQVAALAARGLTAMLIVDEPALAACPAPPAVWDPLRAIAPCWGLHLCCAVPWGIVDVAAPDVLSFDLTLGAPDRRAAEVLERHLARGGRVAWGVLAADRPERAVHGAWRLGAALARIGADPAKVGARSMLTPSCGTGRVTLRREAELTAALDQVAARARGREPSGGPAPG